MEGTIAPMRDICKLAKKYNVRSWTRYAVGLYGDRGGGVEERDNIQEDISVVSGTLDKAFRLRRIHRRFQCLYRCGKIHSSWFHLPRR